MLQTEDLFLGALGLIRGGQLRGIEVHGHNGRRLAVFVIDGEGMDEVEREYHGGQATVDLRLIKAEVGRLKNLAFAALREEMRDGSGSQPGRNRPGQTGEPHHRGHR